MTEITHFEQPVDWQGFDHVALATPDLESSIHFYCEILGMQAGEIYEARGGKTRHCFIKPGMTRSQGLHIWEVPGAKLPPRFESLEWHQPDTITAGALLHIAFTLPDEAAGLALRARLEHHHIEVGETHDLGPLRSMVFIDINGIMIEAIWPREQ